MSRISGRKGKAVAKDKPLNDRQRRFAELVVSGRPAGRAYEEAGYDARGNVADSAAERLLRNVGVQAYLVELRAPQRAAAVLSRQKKREILAEIATGAIKGTTADRYRAIQIDNAMTGDNEPVKIEGEITLRRILEAIDESPMSKDDD